MTTDDTTPPDDATVDRALGAALDELIDAIHETKQAVWSASDPERHRALENLRLFLVDRVTEVGAAEAGIDGRSPLLLSPTGHPSPNLAVRAGNDPSAMVQILVTDLEALGDDVRAQARRLAGRDEADFLTRLADGLDEHLAGLRA